MTTPNRYVGGALDLSSLGASRNPEHNSGAQSGGSGTGNSGTGGSQIETFFTVTESNFENEVLRRSMQVPVIVVIGSDRADATAQLRTDFQALAQGQRSFVVGYVDADTTPQIAQAFGIQALPSVVALAGGQPLANFQGGQPKENLQQWIQAILQAVAGKLEGLPEEPKAEEPAEDPREAEALDALNRSDFDAAIEIYDQILADTNDAAIRQARAAAVVLRRSTTEQREEFAAADQEIIAGDPEKAFDGLIELMKTSAGEEKDEIKERLIELFGLFGNADPRVKAARTKLASALY